MKQTILGIDIGTYSIKIAEVERTFNSYDFANFYERKIQYNELLKPEESMAVTLQGMIDDFGLQWDQVICGYPGQKISSRLITLPFGNLKKIDQTLEFELESYLPFDLESILVDYHVLKTSKESSDILTFYTFKEEFSQWLSQLQNCRVDPKIVTVEASEFLNLLCLGMIPPATPYAIIDIGHAKTNIVIGKGKNLGFIRSIPLAGKAISEAIHKKMGVPVEEAERMKIEMGTIPSEEDAAQLDDLSGRLGSAIKESLDELLVGIRQIFFAYKDRDKEPIEGIYLTGGTTRLPGMDRYFSYKLKQNVTYIDPTNFHFSKLGKTASHRAMMAQGLGLALRSVSASGLPQLNFRQGEFGFKGELSKIRSTMIHLGISLGLIFLLGLTYFGVKYFILSGQVERYHEQITGLIKTVLKDDAPKNLSSPEAALKALKTKKSALQKRLAILSLLEVVLVIDILKDISQKVPDRKSIILDIEELNLKGDQVSVKGSTDSFVSVDKIKTALEDSKLLENVTPGSTRKGVQETEYKFEMSMDLTGRGKAKAKTKEKKPKRNSEDL